MSAAMTINPAEYHAGRDVGPYRMHHALANQVMQAHHLDPNRVTRIELDEAEAIVWMLAKSLTFVRWAEHGSTIVFIRRRYPHGGTA